MRCLMCVVAVVMVGSGCTKPNPEVCCVTFEDCNSLGISDQRPCSSDLACINHECVEPPPGCLTDQDCTSPASHCASDSVCVECVESSQCPMSAPNCSPDRTCVECLTSEQCPSSAPVCEVSAHACHACTKDDDCASSVCDQNQGVCIAEAEIAFASSTGPDTGSCTKAAPCSLDHAVAITTGVRRTVKLLPGSYSTALVLSDKTITFDGPGAIVNSATTPFRVNGNSIVKLVGLTVIASTGNSAVRCDSSSSSLELDQTLIDAYTGSVVANPCVLKITRSRIRGRDNTAFVIVAGPSTQATIDRSTIDGGDGIVAAAGALVRITNSLIVNQTGADGAFSYKLFTTTPGALFVSFSTIVNSLVNCNDTVSCGATPAGLCVDSSVIFNGDLGAPANTVTGPGCNTAYSIVFPQQAVLAGSNNQIGVDPKLADPTNSDFHLRAGSPAIDAANPASTNPVDFDGVARPQGLHADVGAFERP